jgi:hypothetical protein
MRPGISRPFSPIHPDVGQGPSAEKSAACPRTGGRCARSGEEAIADRPSHARPSTAIAAAAMRAPATASHEAATRKARRRNYNQTAALGSCLRAVLEETARWLGYEALDRSRQVIALCGGFNMLMGEFLTASQHQLPVKVVVYNNSCFGLIPLEAEAAGLPRFREGVEFPNPDFVGFKGEKPSELRNAIHEALACDDCRLCAPTRRSLASSARRARTGDRRCGCRRRRDAEHAASRPLPGWALRAGQGQGSGSRGDRHLTRPSDGLIDGERLETPIRGMPVCVLCIVLNNARLLSHNPGDLRSHLFAPLLSGAPISPPNSSASRASSSCSLRRSISTAR